MFAKLTNEAALSFVLRNEGPLLINSGAAAKIRPRRDMSFVRAIHEGKETAYLPGSSIKGVFRSRYEQVMRALGLDVCDTFDTKTSKTCNKKIRMEESGENGKNARKHLNGSERYDRCCEACKLFGTLALGGRIGFADAYPLADYACKFDIRHGVGIDRITGAAFPGALYDIEVLSDGRFAVQCKLTNFKLYQLRAVLWVLEDIHQGLVTFGMGGSRGAGQMRIHGGTELIYRSYADDAPVIDGTREETLFGNQVQVSGGLSEIIAALQMNTRDEFLKAIKDGR